MAEENFVHKTLDKLLDVIEVELKLPLGFAEVKMSPTAIAKEWRENQKKRNELENAIQRAEEKFTEKHKDQKVAQMLHELPLHSEEEFKQVIARLLTHLEEEKITWLAEVQLTKTWGNIVSAEDIRKALELYLPYLRHELNGIQEFREVISALTLERIDETTRRIESKLDRVLDAHTSKDKVEEPDFWYIPHPYPMPPNFTGRDAEQKMLDNWLSDNTNRLFILRALGGFGKSALAWQWINTHVNPAEWTKLVWWSFYEGDASFEHFIEETLKYLNIEPPQGQRPQVDELLRAMQGGKILLIMDGFERALRLYANMNAAYQNEEGQKIEETQLDCVNINADFFLKGVCSLPNIKSKVLMTTRLTPRAIKPHDELIRGCFEKELKEMDKADAVAFFHAQGIQGNRTEIEAACAPYGYHPLSLRILAGVITNDREKPSDIVAAENLDITEDLVQNQHHILEVAYNSLSTQEQKLLSNISCLRSATNYQTIKAIHSIPSRQRKRTKINVTLDDSLRKLESIGLLQWERKTNKYDLHPIVRKYAYIRLNDTEKIKTHTRLRDYFAAIEPPTKIGSLDDLATLIELYYHTVRGGELDKGGEFFYHRLSNSLYYQFSAYHLIIELAQLMNPDTEKIFNKLKNENIKAWMLSVLASSYSDSGQPLRGLPLLKKQISIREKQGSQMNIGIGFENLANSTQIPIGNLQDAEKSLQLSITAFQKAGDLFREATSHSTLGQLFCYLAEWDRAKYEMNLASQSFQFFPQAQSELETFHVLLYLLMNRDKSQSSLESLKSALQHAKLALELAKQQKEIGDPNERSFIRAHWLLGAVYRIKKEFKLAEHHLIEESLSRCRSTNLVASEADILTSPACATIKRNTKKPNLLAMKRCPSPSVAATSCKAQM